MRIRTIKPEFWMSERMCSLGAETRLLAIGLLNYADDAGYFLAHPALIRGALMPFAEGTGSIQRMLDELVEIEYLRIGEDEAKRKIGLVVNFKKHQRVDRPQRSKLEGLVSFPNWSPMIPGIVGDDSAKAQGLIVDDSTNVRGWLAAGMEGNGMEKEGIREGSGKPSPDKPGGGVALPESSMLEAENAGCNGDDIRTSTENADLSSDTVADEAAESAKKKKGGGPIPEGGRRKVPKVAKKEVGPEFPLDLPTEYRGPLTEWWEYKRERREGYKAKGWEVLVRQQQRFPVAQVKASVEVSMANNWAGLFTERQGDERSSLGQVWGAKKRGGAGQQIVVEDTRAPAGFELGCAALYGAVTPWAMLGEGQQGEVREWLKANVKGALPPCDWQLVWDEIYGPLPVPETWADVLNVARRRILAWIEEKKNGGRGE